MLANNRTARVSGLRRNVETNSIKTNERPQGDRNRLRPDDGGEVRDAVLRESNDDEDEVGHQREKDRNRHPRHDREVDQRRDLEEIADEDQHEDRKQVGRVLDALRAR